MPVCQKNHREKKEEKKTKTMTNAKLFTLHKNAVNKPTQSRYMD